MSELFGKEASSHIMKSNIMKDDFNWYMNKMLCSVIQSCGRGVRSKEDYCTTYILDGAIVESVVNNKHKLPKYFIDRFL